MLQNNRHLNHRLVRRKRSQRKAISPVVATALLLVVAVTAVVAFQGWFVQFSSSTFVNIEEESSGNLRSSDVQIVGDSLFFKNSDSDNLTVRRIEIEGNECTGVNGSYARGMSDLNVSGCLGNVSTATPEIVMVTDQGVLEKKVYIDQYDVSVENITGYFRRITVNNPTASPINDQQFHVTLNTRSLVNNGKLKPSCENLRVKDSDRTTDLDHWVSSCNYTNAYVYFKIPSLAASSSKDIYLYYGNESQNTSLTSYGNTMETPWIDLKNISHVTGYPIEARSTSTGEFYTVGGHDLGGEWEYSLNKWYRNGTINWNRFSDPTGDIDRPWDAVVDSSDSIYMTGFENGKYEQIRIEKYDASGNNLWNYSKDRVVGGDDGTKHITLDSSENHVYISGLIELNSTDDAMYVEKVTTGGTYAWNYTSNPSTQPDVSKFIGVDSSDNVYIGGVDRVNGDKQWRLEKVSPSGDSLWNYTSNPTSNNDVIEEGIMDSEGNILLAGYQNDGSAAWRVEKISPSGESIWNYTSDLNPSQNEYAYDIQEMNDGSYIVLGEDYNGGWVKAAQKISRDGKNVANYTMDYAGYEAAHGFAQFSNGEFVIVGEGGTNDIVMLTETKPYNSSISVSMGSERTYE